MCSYILHLIFREKHSLVKGYLHYWLHASNEHSLQAPFIYRLYREVIKRDSHHPAFDDIEATRQSFLRSSDTITMEDMGAPTQVSSRPDRTVRSIARHSLSSPKFSRLLYRLTTDQQSEYIIELGTSLGINTLYLSLARSSAQVYTLEGIPAIADRAEQAFHHLKRTNIQLIRGNIDRTLSDALTQVPRVDLAYLDANHRYEPTVRYFEQLAAKTNDYSIIVVDDIYWSSDMRRAWQYIKQHPSVTLSLDIFDAGIVFFLPLTVRQEYTLEF